MTADRYAGTGRRWALGAELVYAPIAAELVKLTDPPDPYAGPVSGVVTLTCAEGTIWVAEHTRLGMSLMT
jgi:hypothetical protein